MSQSEQH
jgi:hypothetical protein